MTYRTISLYHDHSGRLCTILAPTSPVATSRRRPATATTAALRNAVAGLYVAAMRVQPRVRGVLPARSQ